MSKILTLSMWWAYFRIFEQDLENFFVGKIVNHVQQGGKLRVDEAPLTKTKI